MTTTRKQTTKQTNKLANNNKQQLARVDQGTFLKNKHVSLRARFSTNHPSNFLVSFAQVVFFWIFTFEARVDQGTFFTKITEIRDRRSKAIISGGLSWLGCLLCCVCLPWFILQFFLCHLLRLFFFWIFTFEARVDQGTFLKNKHVKKHLFCSKSRSKT